MAQEQTAVPAGAPSRCWFVFLQFPVPQEPRAGPAPYSSAEHPACSTVLGPHIYNLYSLRGDLQHCGGRMIPKSRSWRQIIRQGRTGSTPALSAAWNISVHARTITLCECNEGKWNGKSAVNSQ